MVCAICLNHSSTARTFHEPGRGSVTFMLCQHCNEEMDDIMPTEMPSTTEREFQAQVIKYAELAGWLVYHTYDSRRSQPGFPDLVLVRNKTVVFAELKSEKGRPTKAQKMWLYALEDCETVITRIWRPRDWNKVEAVLR